MAENLIPVPDPPCDRCTGLCCKSHRPISVELQEGEREQFPEAIKSPDEVAAAAWGREAWGLPVVDGKCIHLGDDDRCQIYERRPQLCRQYNCLHGYYCGHPLSRSPHSFIMDDHPQLIQLAESVDDQWAKQRVEMYLDRKAKQKA